MTILIDYVSSSTDYHVDEDGQDFYGSIRFASVAMSNPRSLAKFLSHPGCVGEPREFLLQRFEELLFHDGKHVLLSDSDSKTEGQDSKPPKPEPPPRRFHHLHDAAAWIEKNWPDFDLEATHPVIWRGER